MFSKSFNKGRPYISEIKSLVAKGQGTVYISFPTFSFLHLRPLLLCFLHQFNTFIYSYFSVLMSLVGDGEVGERQLPDRAFRLVAAAGLVGLESGRKATWNTKTSIKQLKHTNGT
jgi:hypothetical protein